MNSGSTQQFNKQCYYFNDTKRDCCTWSEKKLEYTETQYSKRARQTPFVYYIESFTISRQSISIKSHEGSWVLFTISRILLYRGLLYRVSGVLSFSNQNLPHWQIPGFFFTLNHRDFTIWIEGHTFDLWKQSSSTNCIEKIFYIKKIHAKYS